MAPSRSKDAIYSGYLLSVDDFKRFFATLMDGYSNELLPMHIPAYDSWRRRLPQADRAKVPKLRRACHLLHYSCFLVMMLVVSDSFSWHG